METRRRVSWRVPGFFIALSGFLLCRLAWTQTRSQQHQYLQEEFKTESNKTLQREEKVNIDNDNNSSSGSSNPVEPTSSCPISVLDPNNFTSERDFYKAVHQSTYPACAAGNWTYRPDLRLVLSREHLQCLDQERQGNCHDPDAWKHSDDVAKKSRHESMMKQAVLNSPGILNASDPWVWTSNLEPYKVLPIDNKDEYISRVRRLFLPNPMRIFFVGDSLTRQWQHAIKCELEHVVGIPKERVDWMIQSLPMHTGWSLDLLTKRYKRPFQNATERDYIVFNFGHHVGKKLGNDWPSEYARLLSTSFSMDFGRIPDHHIFFRTTTVRHFLAGQGDWNTESSKAGGIRPDPEMQWWTYGGNSPEQPMQNLLAFDTFLCQGGMEEDTNLSYQATIDYVASKRKNYNVTTPMVAPKKGLYGRKDWEELPDNIQKAAQVLGYNQQLWDSNTTTTATFQKEYQELLPIERQAVEKLGARIGTRHFRILDTSPMMLPRGDASFDGNHFCLPGPMEFWSRMLYYQMEQGDPNKPGL